MPTSATPTNQPFHLPILWRQGATSKPSEWLGRHATVGSRTQRRQTALSNWLFGATNLMFLTVAGLMVVLGLSEPARSLYALPLLVPLAIPGAPAAKDLSARLDQSSRGTLRIVRAHA